jgi:ketosteroid isomerase-like protein
MSEQDVAIVRRLLEFQAGDPAATPQEAMSPGHAFLLMWHPDCVIEEMAEVPDTDVYRGRDGVVRYFRQLDEMWDAVSYTTEELLDGPDGVLSATDIRGRSKSGIDAKLRVYQVYRVREGMIAFATAYSSREPALAAVGL